MLGRFLKTPQQRRGAAILFAALLVAGLALLWLQP